MAKSSSVDELVIGVLGGMGPQATADFLSKLVAATPVEREQDHLRVLIDCNPKVPERNGAVAGRSESPEQVLAAMAQGLERSGADFLVMACNTAHAFASAIRAAITIPFVDMIEETGEACVRLHPEASCIGLLAAQGCLDARLYQDALAARDRHTLVLDAADQAAFMTLLYRIKRGDLSDDVRTRMRSLADKLIASGADVVIAACTEVPLVLASTDLARPLVDPAVVVAERCVCYARRVEPLLHQATVTA